MSLRFAITCQCFHEQQVCWAPTMLQVMTMKLASFRYKSDVEPLLSPNYDVEQLGITLTYPLNRNEQSTSSLVESVHNYMMWKVGGIPWLEKLDCHCQTCIEHSIILSILFTYFQPINVLITLSNLPAKLALRLNMQHAEIWPCSGQK